MYYINAVEGGASQYEGLTSLSVLACWSMLVVSVIKSLLLSFFFSACVIFPSSFCLLAVSSSHPGYAHADEQPAVL